ncbi:hypothetical protein SAMD00019534_125960, partial [Acytostelium subglobosum LB1]|uniref:hypothetical protein n=1 Tax=Acytostelium subglobosum LB1 TaxID=1410327 RepID=UPI000644A674
MKSIKFGPSVTDINTNTKTIMRTLAIVTGASRGFGANICKELANKIEQVDFLLYARSQSGLESTQAIIKQIKPSSDVKLFATDFARITELETVWRSSLDAVEVSKYDRVWLFNNHGSLGGLVRVEEYDTKVKTLNWAPGILDTDMQKEVREKTPDPNTRQYFIDLKENNKLVDQCFSAGKMIDTLVANTFSSGDHIDIYDIMNK